LLELLIQWGVNKAEAVKVILRSLKKYDVRCAEGKNRSAPIDADQLARWRYELREMTKPSPAKRIFDDIVRGRQQFQSHPTPQQASDLADECIRGLYHEGF